MKDSRQRLLPDGPNDMASLTPAKCIQSCKDKGYSFAGVQNVYQCFCGNEAPPQSTIVARHECKMACLGDSSIKCGGHWRMNVFEISGMISIQLPAGPAAVTRSFVKEIIFILEDNSQLLFS